MGQGSKMIGWQEGLEHGLDGLSTKPGRMRTR